MVGGMGALPDRPPDRLTRDGYRLEVEDDFSSASLNTALWVPYYLPHWSSRAASAARYGLTTDGTLQPADRR